MDTQLTLTQEIEIIDEFDRFLLEDILLMVQNTNTMALVSFWGHQQLHRDKADEEFFKKVVRAVSALIKANALRRNYRKIIDSLAKEIEESEEIKGTRIDMLFNKVDAFILIEAFFGQIKTALDLLAQSLKPIYGLEFHTWERKHELSGMHIVGQLENNLSGQLKTNALPVANLIRINAESITKIVAHRDDATHYGKLNKVQGFRYSVEHKKIIPPLILISETESDYVDKYMDEVLKYVAEFTQELLITLLSNLLPDMQITKRGQADWGWSSSVPIN